MGRRDVSPDSLLTVVPQAKESMATQGIRMQFSLSTCGPEVRQDLKMVKRGQTVFRLDMLEN